MKRPGLPGTAVVPVDRPGSYTIPNPSDLLLFADAPGSARPDRSGGTGEAGSTGEAGGTGGGRGSAGGPSGTHGAGRRTPALLPAPRPRRTRLLALTGAAAVACGVAIMIVAVRSESGPRTASAPVADSVRPAVPALPAGPGAGSGEDGFAIPETPRPGDGTSSQELEQRTAGNEHRPGTTTHEPSKVPGDGNSGTGKGKDDGQDSGESGTGAGSRSGAGGGSAGTPPSAPSRQRAIQAVNYPDRYWNVRGGHHTGTVFLDTVARSAATFTVTAGLADSDCYSFSLGKGRYLRHLSFRLRADTNDHSALFKRDATFCPRSGAADGTVMLESYNYPGRFVRHREFQLRLDPYQRTALYRADSTFRMVNG
ncbi:AbfB domain-containing protein [Streptomyces sp. NPDC088400]|uniref:AbfB domain-containing protein n=1 Tax=Streptomyces sp. NPDC088400 TaxID=3365861 RepID=UPI00381396BB